MTKHIILKKKTKKQTASKLFANYDGVPHCSSTLLKQINIFSVLAEFN